MACFPLRSILAVLVAVLVLTIFSHKTTAWTKVVFSSVVTVSVPAHRFAVHTVYTDDRLFPGFPNQVSTWYFWFSAAGSQYFSFNNLLLEWSCWEACMLCYSFMTSSCENQVFWFLSLLSGVLTCVNALIYSHHHHFQPAHYKLVTWTGSETCLVLLPNTELDWVLLICYTFSWIPQDRSIFLLLLKRYHRL